MAPPSLWRLCSSRSARSGRPVLAWGEKSLLGLPGPILRQARRTVSLSRGGCGPIARNGAAASRAPAVPPAAGALGDAAPASSSLRHYLPELASLPLNASLPFNSDGPTRVQWLAVEHERVWEPSRGPAAQADRICQPGKDARGQARHQRLLKAADVSPGGGRLTDREGARSPARNDLPIVLPLATACEERALATAESEKSKASARRVTNSTRLSRGSRLRHACRQHMPKAADEFPGGGRLVGYKGVRTPARSDHPLVLPLVTAYEERALATAESEESKAAALHVTNSMRSPRDSRLHLFHESHHGNPF